MNSESDSFSPDAFVERLREMRKATGRTGANIAQQGNITKQTFSGYLHTGRQPSACVLANWVFRLGVNANWLLTGRGPMLLEEESGLDDPLVRCIAAEVARLRQAGAGDEELSVALIELLQSELCHAQKTPALAKAE